MKQIKLAILSCVLLVSMLIGNVSVVSANIGDVFTAKIELVSPAGTTSEIECTFKVLKEATSTGVGEVQVGDGIKSAIDMGTSGAITIPDTVKGKDDKQYKVTTIGEKSFILCEGLTSTGLESNKTVTTIGEKSFILCEGLTSTGLESNKTVTTIGKEAFFSCQGLTSTGLESNKTITTIGEGAFAFCEGLTSTGLESNEAVTTIGEVAFYSCLGLTSTGLESNNTVTTIGEGAFRMCESLVSVILAKDSAITSIGDAAFSACSKLETFVFKNNTIPNLGIGVFEGNTTIYYPEGAEHADRLQGYTTKAFKLNNIKVDESSLTKQYKAKETFTLEGVKFKIQYEVEGSVYSKLDETIRYEDEVDNFKLENVILKEGENTIKYSYLGKTDSFKVNALAPTPDAPETGDSKNRTLLVSILIISGLGIVILGLRKKKLVK